MSSSDNPRLWLARGGGGFEGGLEGIKAATFTGEGLVEMLYCYRRFLLEHDDLWWRYYNDRRFHDFVENMIEEADRQRGIK